MKRITSIETIRRRFTSADFSGAEANDTPLDPCSPGDDTEHIAIPQRIEALIAQRQAAQDAAFHPIPLPGQIVRVPPQQDDAGNYYNECLAVLLDTEIAAGKWRGWLVGRDPEYASEWDLLLGPEEEPRDPMCQVIQTWNPVSLSIQEADLVIAELSVERFTAARALARDYANKLIPTPIDDHRMGVHLARELSEGTGVVTGTSLAAQNDPRTEYQRLYRDAALWISQSPLPASIPSSAPTREPWRLLSAWIGSLFDFRQGNWLKPAAAFATLLIVPLMLMLMLREQPESNTSPGNRYISGSSIQEQRAAQPTLKAREIEERLRAIGATPEIRHEAGGTIALQVDLTPLTETDRTKFLAAYGFAAPADLQLRLLIVPAEKGTEKGSP